MENHVTKNQSPQTNPAGSSTSAQTINRVAARIAIVLSGIALLAVLSGYLQPPRPRPTDEGSAAHIFQLSIAALFPTIMVFLFSADWKRPAQSARRLAVPAAALAIAFAALFYLEHYR